MKKIILTLFAFAIFQEVVAQHSFVSCGGDVVNSNGSSSISVGELFTNRADYYNEGVQQPFEYLLEIQDLSLLSFISIYPNPATETIVLDQNKMNGEITYTLFDGIGNIIKKGRMNLPTMKLDISSLPAAVYQLKIETANRIQSYKIIKSSN
jgi:hypothetical protein